MLFCDRSDIVVGRYFKSSQGELKISLKELKASGFGVFCTTHDLDLIRMLLRALAWREVIE